MKDVSVASLREIIAELIAASIEVHRASRAQSDSGVYSAPVGNPTDDEIDEFLFHNPLLDEETVEQLTDPGLLGFSAKRANATAKWLAEFRASITDWAGNQSWLGADESLRVFTSPYTPAESDIWTPTKSHQPAWLANAPSYILLAADLLKNGRLLSELPWRDFEDLIAALLQAEGWFATVTQPTRDGGIDVIAKKVDPVLGELCAVWQAKKYRASNKVKLHEVRELSAVRDDIRATKGFIVTTSSLTRDAVAWVKRDLYRLGYKEHDEIKDWLNGAFLG